MVLLPFLKKEVPECFVKLEARNLSCYRIAIDGQNWLFTMLGNSVKTELNKLTSYDGLQEENVFRSLLRMFLFFNIRLLNYKITPVWIWDGDSMPAKLETKEKRREERQKRYDERQRIKDELDKMTPLERPTELIEKYKKLVAQTFYFSKDNIDQLKYISKLIGLPTITARTEAERLAAALGARRMVACVWSSDTDTYALGAPFVTKSIVPDQNGLIIEGVFTLEILKKLNMTHMQFRDFCIMCGTDFGKRIKGVGPAGSFETYSETRGY